MRTLHRWVGLLASVFLLLIASTGFLLSLKGELAWMRPPEAEGAPLASAAQIAPLDQVLSAAYGAGFPDLAKWEHVDRVDYRPKDNIFKVVSRDGYREVQVCGATAKVLSASFRRDQMVEDLHDFSYFASVLRTSLGPVVAACLFLLGLSGIIVFFTPVVRRWRYRRRAV